MTVIITYTMNVLYYSAMTVKGTNNC